MRESWPQIRKPNTHSASMVTGHVHQKMLAGTSGYAEFLRVLADPKDAEHEHYREWAPGFHPEDFSPAHATERMHKGLSDWHAETDHRFRKPVETFTIAKMPAKIASGNSGHA